MVVSSIATMGQIRSFVPEDIPQAADLHERVMYGRSRPSSYAKRSYWEQVFFDNPWYDDSMPSLVCENGGVIVGFLGVMPRKMQMNGQPVQAVVCTHFVVEPRSRGLTGLKLMSRLLSGPQDISLSEGNSRSTKLFVGLGGSISPIYSIHWTSPLRPARFIAHYLGKSSLMATLALASRPLTGIVDTLAARVGNSPFRQLTPTYSADSLDVDTLLHCLSEFTRDQTLRPVYDKSSLKWLLQVLDQKKGLGSFRKVALRNAERDIVGWYLYYSVPGGFSQVVQIGATSNSIRGVIDHLFHDAWERGSVAVGGQAEPEFMQEFSRRGSLLNRSGGHLLVHARNPELMHAMKSGDAFFSRLEGEWWIPAYGVAHGNGYE